MLLGQGHHQCGRHVCKASRGESLHRGKQLRLSRATPVHLGRHRNAWHTSDTRPLLQVDPRGCQDKGEDMLQGLYVQSLILS